MVSPRSRNETSAKRMRPVFLSIGIKVLGISILPAIQFGVGLKSGTVLSAKI
jgi:hypothetical protein